jgi:hypothetical protein
MIEDYEKRIRALREALLSVYDQAASMCPSIGKIARQAVDDDSARARDQAAALARSGE